MTTIHENKGIFIYMQVIIKRTTAEIADLVSEKFVSLLEKKPKAVLGLATGSTPIATYEALINKIKAKNLPLEDVKTFNLDEYVGLEKEKYSYRTFMEENLFSPLGISSSQVHFPSKKTLSAYDEQIAAYGGIDLQILGIGSNGHIAFNEPGTPFESKTHVVKLEESTRDDNARFFDTPEEVPTHAVTMGLATILQAKEIVLIATGTNKQEAVRQMLSGVNSLNCPASILNQHPHVTVYLDEEAAGKLY